MHPMYYHARTLVGQHVCVHAHGRLHRGILQHVTQDGIYVNPSGAVAAAGDGARADFVYPLAGAQDTPDAAHVWFPFLFFPWLAIAALGPWWWW